VEETRRELIDTVSTNDIDETVTHIVVKDPMAKKV
jgi:hypothetical protein